jgi:uncharacterized Ntn-hydrolase superfamily protein
VHIKAGVGVIAHQASANPMYGEIGLTLLQAGYSPQQALDMMLRSDQGRDSRQVAILDVQGRSASWDGPGANDWKGHKCGADYCAQGDILAGAGGFSGRVIDIRVDDSRKPLADLRHLLNLFEAGSSSCRRTVSWRPATRQRSQPRRRRATKIQRTTTPGWRSRRSICGPGARRTH